MFFLQEGFNKVFDEAIQIALNALDIPKKENMYVFVKAVTQFEIGIYVIIKFDENYNKMKKKQPKNQKYQTW